MDYELEPNELLSSLNEDQLYAGLSISDLEARLAQEPLEPRTEMACGLFCDICVWQ